MIPHERSLVENLKDRPFVLLGVNTDPVDDKLRDNLKKSGVTWRSWCEGSTRGPIAKRFNVKAYPTIFVLDSKHVIREIDPSDDELEKKILTLIEEAEKQAAGSK